VSAPTLRTLVGHAWVRHRVPLAAITLAIALFHLLLTRVAPSPNEMSWMSMLLSSLPPEMRSLMGNETALSSGGFLAFAYVHPFFILLLSVWVVRVTTASFAAEIGRGTMDLLAARPVPRWQFVTAAFLTVSAGLAIVLLTAWGMTTVGMKLRDLDGSPQAFFRIVLVAWLLFSAWGAIGIAISATRRDAGPATAVTTGVIAGSFVLDYLARLWAPIARLRPLSLFRYYEPQAILAGGVSKPSLLVLGLVMVSVIATALVLANRRDL
jgi:ABC-type transport system involved in multi-copper enzyme maturation permease subunit